VFSLSFREVGLILFDRDIQTGIMLHARFSI
jgi:hypothetical protein